MMHGRPRLDLVKDQTQPLATSETAGLARTLRFTSNIAGPIFFIADLLCIAVSGVAALFGYSLLRGGTLVLSVNLFAFCAAAATYLLIRTSRHAYRRALANLYDHEADTVVDALASVLIASALVWQFGMIGNLSRGITLLFVASFSICLLISRPLVRFTINRLAKAGAIEQRIAFYGADPDSLSIIQRTLENLKLNHLRVIGVADDRPRVDQAGDLPLIGNLDDLLHLSRTGQVDLVLFCVRNMPAARLRKIVERLSAVSVDVALIPSEAIELAPDYRVNLLGQIPILTLWQRPFRDINRLVKRGEDLLVGTLATILLAPVMLVTALLVRLSSPGPVLFVQPRIGFNNEIIHVFKFRTMFADRADYEARQTTTADDPRITPIGRVLRRFSMDELPQLLNVLKGEMSLIGPRPHATHMKVGDRFYQDAVRGYAGRHRVRPGITGLAQVKGVRGEIRTVERAKLRVDWDMKYIENWSLWLDVKILAQTVRAVLWDRDAY
jgi:Undecaprenyl-phosphate glucose phosphotransferase